MRYLEKFIPEQDKLKHFFIGALAFVSCSIFFSDLISLAIVFAGAFIVEIYQKIDGGTNSKVDMAWDIFYGVLLGMLIILVSLF